MNEADKGMFDMGILLGTGNPLFWQCDKCGWKTARHPATKHEDMPLCHQSLKQPKLMDTRWSSSYGRLEHVYQYHCGGKMVEKVLTFNVVPATVSA